MYIKTLKATQGEEIEFFQRAVKSHWGCNTVRKGRRDGRGCREVTRGQTTGGLEDCGKAFSF